MEICYREKAFHARKKIRKNDFAPQKNFPVMPLAMKQNEFDSDGTCKMFSFYIVVFGILCPILLETLCKLVE